MASKPLFQVALDCVDSEEALRIADLVQDYVDIFEIGTALLKKEGIRIIERMKHAYPEKLVFADTKTVDLGKIEARMMFGAGADIMSVCGIASDETIELAINEAHSFEKKVLIDLIGVGNSYRQVKRISHFHPDYLAVHTGVDERNTRDDLFEKVEITSQISPIPLSISGGIRLDDVSYLLVFHPAIIVVGSAILNSSTPREVAERFWKSINTLSFRPFDYDEESSKA